MKLGGYQVEGKNVRFLKILIIFSFEESDISRIFHFDNFTLKLITITTPPFVNFPIR